MPGQLKVLFITLVVFSILMKYKYSLKILIVSIIAGGMTVAGELINEVFLLYAVIDGIITFMMWYCIIAAIYLFIRFFSNVRE